MVIHLDVFISGFFSELLIIMMNPPWAKQIDCSTQFAYLDCSSPPKLSKDQNAAVPDEVHLAPTLLEVLMTTQAFLPNNVPIHHVPLVEDLPSRQA